MPNRVKTKLPKGKRATLNKKASEIKRVTEVNPFSTLKKVKRSKSANSLWVKLGISTSKSTIWLDEKSKEYYLEGDYKRYKSEKTVKKSIENKAKKMRSKGLIKESLDYLEKTFLGKKSSDVKSKSLEFRKSLGNVAAEFLLFNELSGQPINSNDEQMIKDKFHEVADRALKAFNTSERNIKVDISFMAKYENRYNGENHRVGLSQQDLGAFRRLAANDIISYKHADNAINYPIAITVRIKK